MGKAGSLSELSRTTEHAVFKPLVFYLRRDKHLYLMLIPALAAFIIFRYIPIINGFLIPFVDYNLVDGVSGSPWVGFKWFRQFVQDPFFFRLLRNTVLLGLYSLLFGFPGPIILALLFNELRMGIFKRIAQTISYLPHFIAIVVIVGIIYKLFGSEGVVNTIIRSLGAESINFMGSPGWFRPLYIGSGVWQGIGWGTIIYLAALSGVNPELYESAFIDGANRWQQALFITLPGIMPTISILLILAVANVIDVSFEKVFLMYNPGIYETADVIETYVYRRGIVGMDFAYAQAVSLFKSAFAILLLVMANYVSRKTSETSLW